MENVSHDIAWAVTFGWMSRRMGLSGGDLNVYALIYSFSRNGRSRYFGTQGYIAEFLGMTRQNVIRILKRLEEQNYIIKYPSKEKGMVEYAINPETCWEMIQLKKIQELGCNKMLQGTENDQSCNKMLQEGVTKCYTTCNKMLHNNKPINNNDNKERNIIKKEKAEEHSASNQPNLVVEHSTDMPKGGEAKAAAKEDAEEIYKLYPTTCLNTGRRTGKSTKDKEKIVRLLKKHTKEELKFTIQKYIELSIRDKTYMMNFSTFLNNLPDYSDLIEKEKEKETKLELDQPVFVEI